MPLTTRSHSTYHRVVLSGRAHRCAETRRRSPGSSFGSRMACATPECSVLRTHRPLTAWVLIRIDVSQFFIIFMVVVRLRTLSGCAIHIPTLSFISLMYARRVFQNLFHLCVVSAGSLSSLSAPPLYLSQTETSQTRLLYDKWTGILGPCRIDGFEFRVRLPRVALHDGGHGPYYIQVVLLGLHGRAKGHQRAKSINARRGIGCGRQPFACLSSTSVNESDRFALHTLTIRVVVVGTQKPCQ